MRGRPWRVQKVGQILSDTTYKGCFYFNKRDQNKKLKPKEEWVLINIDPIVTELDYQRVKQKREQQSPKSMPPRSVNSSVFLSGLLKCGECGSTMTLMTGKSGQYRYYKCSNQKHNGQHRCSQPNISMGKLDTLVRERLSERVFTPQRVRNMITMFKKEKLAQDTKAQQTFSN